MARGGDAPRRRVTNAEMSPGEFPDLEDAMVLRVDRAPGQVLLTLQLASMPRRARIRLRELRSESVFHWVGAGIAGDHPDPALPLDFIQSWSWSRQDGTHNLQGTLRGDAWYEWEICAARIDWDVSDPAGAFAYERLEDPDEEERDRARVAAVKATVVRILSARFGHPEIEAQQLFDEHFAWYSGLGTGAWAPADYYDHEGALAIALEIEHHHRFPGNDRKWSLEFLEWRKDKW
jgi:hypothetical protein